MDFSFSEEQLMLQESVQKFVQRNYDFESRKSVIARESGYAIENWRLFAELGWLTVPFREQDGGFSGSAVDLTVIMEEFGRGLVVEPFVATAVLAGGLIAELDSGERKKNLLERLMSGELQLACAFAEPEARFNPANVATSAVSTGNQLKINGRKISVLNGAQADLLLVVVREAGSRMDSDGISVVVVDPKSRGVSLRGYRNVDGQAAADIQFNDVAVPVESRLGAHGQAFAALSDAIDRATIAVSAEAVGALDCLLKKTVEYSKTRKQFGVPIGSFQALQHRMADMFIECQLARSIVMMAAMKLDSNAGALDKSRAVSAAKSRVGKAISRVGEEAVQIHGGIGMTNELDVAHYFKRISAIALQFGNSDFHRARFLAD